MKGLTLTAVVAVVWLAGVPAAALLDEPVHWLAGSVGAVLCLVPALGTLALLRFTENRSPVEAIGAVLVAPLLRLVAVLLIGFVLWRLVPAFKGSPAAFWGWVLGFYLVTLVAETALLMPKAARRPKPDAAGV